MAISTRKKNMIIAQWKTGAYRKSELIKKYKIDRKTLDKFLAGIIPSNGEIIELCTIAENAKMSLKNPHELKAVEEVVLNRMKVQEVSSKLLDKIETYLDRGKAQKVISEGKVVKYNLQSDDFKKLSEAVDRVSITNGVNPRTQTTIENNITQQNNTVQQVQVKFADE